MNNSEFNQTTTSFTKVTFTPDLKRFKKRAANELPADPTDPIHMTKLDDSIVALMKRRVYDLAGTSPPTVKVWYNGLQLPINVFTLI